MASFCLSPAHPTLQKLIHPSKSTSLLKDSLVVGFSIMNSRSISNPKSASSSIVYQVPALNANEMDSIADKTFERYTSKTVKRRGKGVAIVWFRNDLRILDNESLFNAWVSSDSVLPVYCVDPRNFENTHYFGFPKTGGIISSN